MQDDSKSDSVLRSGLVLIAAFFVAGLLAETVFPLAICLYFLAAGVGLLTLLPEAKEAVSRVRLGILGYLFPRGEADKQTLL